MISTHFSLIGLPGSTMCALIVLAYNIECLCCHIEHAFHEAKCIIDILNYENWDKLINEHISLLFASDEYQKQFSNKHEISAFQLLQISLYLCATHSNVSVIIRTRAYNINKNHIMISRG